MFQPLPQKLKRNNPYSGRFGKHAEVMKEQYQVKVKLPKEDINNDKNVEVDGFVDIIQI